MTHDEVIQAHKDGKQIECRRKREGYMDDVWDVVCPIWNFEHFEYRVKREPREWRIGVRKDGSICAANAAWEAVTVREVIEQGGD